jgi:hypothetical protein
MLHNVGLYASGNEKMFVQTLPSLYIDFYMAYNVCVFN